jgi:hypothetical protein
MKVGDLVLVKNNINKPYTIVSTGVIIGCLGFQFWRVVWSDGCHMLHEDCMERF